MNRRPWKKHARIERVEYQSGDVKFRAMSGRKGGAQIGDTREHLDELEADLSAWFRAQIRKVSRA